MLRNGTHNGVCGVQAILRMRVTSGSWDDYPILRFSEVPEVEVVLVDRPEEPPLGAGEMAQGPVAAAIANAVFDATGVRLRRAPLTPERLKPALTGLSPTSM